MKQRKYLNLFIKIPRFCKSNKLWFSAEKKQKKAKFNFEIKDLKLNNLACVI